MNWMVLVAIYLVVDSLIMFIDNFISDVHFKDHLSTGQKTFTGFAYVLYAVILGLIFRIDLSAFSVWIYFAIIGTGIMLSFASVAYYRALEIEDSTNLSIFTQLSPIFYLVFGWFLLGDKFSPTQLIAFALILMAPLLIVLKSRKNSRKTKLRAIALAAIYVITSVLSGVLFIKISSEQGVDFGTSMVFFLLGKGLGNLLLVFVIRRKWSKRYYYVIKRSRGKLRPLLAVESLLCIADEFTYRGALIVAPSTALASAASDSLQPIITLMMGIILTLIWPRFGREKMDKKSVAVRLISTALVVVGIIILQL